MKAIAQLEFPDEYGNSTLDITLDEDLSARIEIDSPWYGSTDTGFGATLSVRLDRDAVDRLHKFLGAYLATIEATP